MPELVFVSKGQAEALAAQEAIAKKGREIKEEFEQGAKSVGKWDSEMAKLHRTSEAALRSVQTEQEKIAAQIDLIKERQEKGIGTVEENEEAIRRLQQRWVELDDATKAQREATAKVAEEHARLKTSATDALRSVQTEEEKVAAEMEAIEDQIKDVEAAMQQGLVPPAEAERGIERLRDRMAELRNSLGDAGTEANRLETVLAKAFDPVQIARWGASFFGIKAAIKGVRDEFEDLQKAVDQRVAAQGAVAGVPVAASLGISGSTIGPGGPGLRPISPEAIVDTSLRAARAQLGNELDAAFSRLAALGDASQVSSEELEKLANILRESGEGALSRKIGRLADRLDEGTVSIDEVSQALRDAARRVGFQALPPGTQAQYESEYIDLRPKPETYRSGDIPARQLEMVQILLRMADTLDRLERQENWLPTE
jgi:DNA repair exonuclease SbcCD ATPase subunit